MGPWVVCISVVYKVAGGPVLRAHTKGPCNYPKIAALFTATGRGRALRPSRRNAEACSERIRARIRKLL